MKLARFADQAAADTPEMGIVSGESIIPLSRLAPDLVRDMTDLITRWETVQAPLRALERDAPATIALNQVRLLAPIQRPGKILAIGLNYADHIAETGLATPTEQVWFCKQPTAVNGPFDAVEIPPGSVSVDYEVELVAVIGSGGRRIAKTDAPGAVFGYCVGNDVTERDYQFRTHQWMVGKSFDTHAPFGPWITTSDEIGDPHRLDIACFVNAEERQHSNTRHLIFNVWDQISYVSEAMTLEPGDLVFSGTPGGVGMGSKPPRYLSEGDTVRCQIEHLGAIENRFGARF